MVAFIQFLLFMGFTLSTMGPTNWTVQNVMHIWYESIAVMHYIVEDAHKMIMPSTFWQGMLFEINNSSVLQAFLSQIWGMRLLTVASSFNRLVGCFLILVSVCSTFYFGPEKEMDWWWLAWIYYRRCLCWDLTYKFSSLQCQVKCPPAAIYRYTSTANFICDFEVSWSFLCLAKVTSLLVTIFLKKKKAFLLWPLLVDK